VEICDLYDRERTALREELLALKHCQISFLTQSVAATGLLLGMGTGLELLKQHPLVQGMLFLVPLVFLLPAWWVFFDKATTITRIVGYYRILESLILGQLLADKYVGWENALRRFRDSQEKLGTEPDPELAAIREKAKKDGRHVSVWRTSHRYWLIAYVTFFLLSLLCSLAGLIFAALKDQRWYLIVLALIASAAFLVTAIKNLGTHKQLIGGVHSYNTNEEIWRKILGVHEPQKITGTTS